MCLQKVSTRASMSRETPALAGGPDMTVERVSGGSSLIDVLDRVLDKGIVIDPWVRISMVGIDLLTAGARVEVASIETCLQYADDADQSAPASRAALSEAGGNGVRELGEVRPHAPPRRRR
jgi:hypothetical protein